MSEPGSEIRELESKEGDGPDRSTPVPGGAPGGARAARESAGGETPAAQDEVRPITILHLSDLQFGIHNRFPWLPQHSTLTHEELLTTLREDLDRLRADHALQPDLVICTGDLAEWGRPSEFAAAFEFLGKLAEYLHLSRSRVIALPGNHDISRTLCQAYFLQCAWEEAKPVPPYYPKWKGWEEAFNAFYSGEQDAPCFGPDQRWHVIELPELRVVIAALNSTLAERHDIAPDEPPNPKEEGHFGLLGAPQCRWFAGELQGAVDRGWLRIGAVHHNVQRGAVDDDENLRDADQARDLLSPVLNLLLHGHTHRADLGWWDNCVPLLATGSAALKTDVLPEYGVNQYQVIQLWPDRLKCWRRMFVAGTGRNHWAVDPGGRESRDGMPLERRVEFHAVHGTFPAADPPPAAAADGRPASRQPVPSLDGIPAEARASRPWDYLDELQEVVEHRERGAEQRKVERVTTPEGDLPYLRVTVVRQGRHECYPVGGTRQVFDRSAFAAFSRIHDQFRVVDPQIASFFVYGGARAGDDDYGLAAGRGRLTLLRHFEFQGLYDFEPYLRLQSDRLRADPQYPPDLYVPQRLRWEDGAGTARTEDALERCCAWVQEPHARFLLVLGSFGHGKSFLLRKLALKLREIDGAPHPILVEMRHLEKGVALRQLLAQHFARDNFAVAPDDFRYMLENGRVCLLFDGFDELVHRVTYEQAAAHLDTILDAVQGEAKVVVTSRTEHFLNDAGTEQAMYRRVEERAGRRMVHLEGFDESRIGEFLRSYYRVVKQCAPEAAARAADQRFRQIRDIQNLAGLSETPRLLGFIAELSDEDLEKARQKDGTITAYQLYERLFTRWFEFEARKAQPPGAPPALNEEDRWEITQELAVLLWSRQEKTIRIRELQSRLQTRVVMLEARNLDAEVGALQVGSGTLLQRDATGNFSFLHRSVQEFLIVRAAAAELKQGGTSPLLERLEGVTGLMAEFFAGAVPRVQAETWLRTVVDRSAAGSGEGAVPQAITNALVLGKRLGLDLTPGLQLAGRDLTGQDFSGRDLSDHDFTASVLRSVNFTGAKLRRAVLRRADLTDALLREVDLSDAELSGAVLAGADLTGARYSPAILAAAVSAGARHTNSVDGGALVWVPAGEFQREPAHRVRITGGFWLGRTAVTNAQYRRFVQATGHREPEYWRDEQFSAEEQPVVGVNWEDAAAYCAWAGGRLPTEAEWEYAARGPESRKYPWGEADPTAELADIGRSKGPLPVGSKPAGAAWCGVLDLAGSVWEWCADWHASDYYAKAPASDPPGPDAGEYRVVRGGSWFNTADLLRASYRNHFHPVHRNYNLGFRVVLSERADPPNQHSALSP